MLEEISFYMKRSDSFGFETTLAARSYLSLFHRLKNKGYSVHFFYLRIPDVELVLSPITGRVSLGGRDVPAPDVRRCFERSIRNFLFRYRSLADSWVLCDNTAQIPRIIASQERGLLRVRLTNLYKQLRSRYGKP
jgi:predicted ABC-type ATPase